MVSTVLEELITNLHALSQSESINKTSQQNSYTGSNKRHLGLKVPVRKKLVQVWCRKHKKDLSVKDFENILLKLTNSDIHDEFDMVGYLIDKCTVLRKQLNLSVLYDILSKAEGWAEVDVICQGRFTGKEFLARRDKWEVLLKKT